MTRAVRSITPGPNWPRQLDDLGEQRPEQLVFRGTGELRQLLVHSVAIVGARRATPTGLAAAERLAGDLAAAGWTIVSGAAHGIDTAAHRGAALAGGVTCGVLAGGIDRQLSAGPRRTAASIAEHGLIIAEEAGTQPPQRRSFLHRNRLIAALTRATVVIEAAERSGALNTARWAESLGRMVMAMPGSVLAETSRGTHAAIRDGRAILVRDTADVWEMLAGMGEFPDEETSRHWTWSHG